MQRRLLKGLGSLMHFKVEFHKKHEKTNVSHDQSCKAMWLSIKSDRNNNMSINLINYINFAMLLLHGQYITLKFQENTGSQPYRENHGHVLVKCRVFSCSLSENGWLWLDRDSLLILKAQAV